MHARSLDTDAEAERVQIDLLRAAGATRRAQMALVLSGEVIGLARRAIRQAQPELSQVEADLRYVELHYGRALATELRHYLDARGT